MIPSVLEGNAAEIVPGRVVPSAVLIACSPCTVEIDGIKFAGLFPGAFAGCMPEPRVDLSQFVAVDALVLPDAGPKKGKATASRR